jgi:hypothetical protein
VSAAFLTGDLFNLFVAFEMMLTASYVLITLGGRRDQVRSGMTYVVISLLASTLFMAVLALVYAATGTVNLADLSVRLAELPDGRRTALAVAMLVVFGIKAGSVPAVLLAARQLPDGAVPGHRGVRRPAHQGRRLRHHPHPDAAVPRPRAHGLILVDRRGDDGGGHVLGADRAGTTSSGSCRSTSSARSATW